MEEEAHLFLDTNVLLHYEALDAINWLKHVKAKSVVLHITQAVMEEISLKKDMGDTKTLRKRAGAIAKRLLKCLETANPFRLREGEVLLLEPETPRMENFPELNPASQDDRLIASALTFLLANPTNCYVVTDDSSLTLRVKLKKWNLQHLPAPEACRLAEPADAEERQRSAREKELAELKRAQPELKLTFMDGENFTRVEPKQRDIEAFIRQKMLKIRKERPLVEEPPSAKYVTFHATGTPAEVQAYNRSLEQFYSKYETWLRQAVSIKDRTVDVKLMVFNGGSVPAESVLVKVHFPDGFKLIKLEALPNEYPKFPEGPKKPGFDFAILRGLQNSTMFLSSPRLATKAAKPSMSIKKTHSYEVEWEHAKLRQNTSEALDELTAVFESKISSFKITFELRADNLRKVVKGNLHVIAP